MKRKNRVETLLNDSKDFDAFIIKSPADVAYLIGISFPYPDQSPYSIALIAGSGDPVYTLILPVEWECVLKNFTWKGKKVTYSINDGSPNQAYRAALKKCIDSMNIADKRVSIDYESWTAGEIKFLNENYPEMQIGNLDEQLNRTRTVKSADEIANIRLASHIADRGMIGALNHVEGTGTAYTLAEFLERVRVHAIEFGANCIGHLNLSMGQDGQSWYTPIEDLSQLELGNFVRADYSVAVNGCWTSCSRMFYAGKPDQEELNVYAENITLKNYALSLLKPGVAINEFCAAVQEKADEMGIEALLDEGLGHGVGMSENEAPFLTFDNEETLCKGMVIALDIKTLGTKGEMIHSVDIYELTENGTRKLSDFRDWDKLYIINGVHATH